MNRILLPVLVTVLACSAVEAPAPLEPPPAPPPVPSFEELQREFLPRIDDNKRTVDSYEERKDEIVTRKLEDLERLREIQKARAGEIENKRKKRALLEEQLETRRARLADVGGPADEALKQEIAREVAELEAEFEREAAEIDAQLAESRRAAEEIRRLEQADREDLFLDEVRPLYREGIELHLGFYRGVIDLARQELAPGEKASALIDHFEDRIATRDRLLEVRDVGPEAFASLRHEFELDQRMSQAWLSAFILEVRFSINESSLTTVSEAERDELELLAESLQESWQANPRLVMYVDGHADSKQFRGRTPCVSATKNRQLSRRRAEAVSVLFRDKLPGDGERIQVDWFGNFSPQTRATSEELANRRIELRIASRRPSGGFDSHRDYFAMRQGLELGGRRFRRAQGSWIESSCEGGSPEIEVEYLSDRYADLVNRLGVEGPVPVRLGVDERELAVRLGNSFVVRDGETCVSVRPCPDSDD